MGVSLTYPSTQGPIGGAYQKECRVHEYEVSICEKEGSWDREIVLPEEVDFVVGGDEVLEDDEYWEGAAVSVVPCMWEMRLIGIDLTLRSRHNNIQGCDSVLLGSNG